MTLPIKTARYQAVLFDLDGTLVDTNPDFVNTINAMRKLRSLTPLDSELIRPYVSNGSLALVQHCLIKEANEDINSLRAEFLETFHQYNGQEARLFKGMNDFLGQLKHTDTPWGIVTQKPIAYAQPLLRKLNLDKSCRVLVCPDKLKQSKPDPEGLLLACDHLGIEAYECLYIGDHQRDIDAGKNARMDTVAASYGYINADINPHDWQADYTIDAPHQLKSILFPNS